jgi:hypothetical protein
MLSVRCHKLRYAGRTTRGYSAPMMKRAALFAFALAACQPDFDFDIDLSGLEPGPIPGDNGAVTFSLVDGCPGNNFLWGCPKTMPPFAVGARARMVIGSMTGEATDEATIAGATFVVSNPRVLAFGRDADGFVVVDALAEGTARVEIDDKNGALIDSIYIEVERIVSLTGDTRTMILEGARLGAQVAATGTSGRELFARGAVMASLSDAIQLDEDQDGFFSRSDEVVIRSMKLELPPTNGDPEPDESIARRRPGHITWSAGAVTTDVSYSIVSHEEITAVQVAELWHEPDAYKQHLHAEVKVGETWVRGGGACEWKIVSGGGDGAAIAAGVGDDARSDWAYFDLALVYGEGDMTVECRANDRAAAQATTHLGP